MRRVDSFSEYKACSVSGAIPNITCFYFLSAPLDRLRRPEPQRSRSRVRNGRPDGCFLLCGALRLLYGPGTRRQTGRRPAINWARIKTQRGNAFNVWLPFTHQSVRQYQNLESPDQSVTEAEKAAAAISRPDRMIQPLTQSTQAKQQLGFGDRFHTAFLLKTAAAEREYFIA